MSAKLDEFAQFVGKRLIHQGYKAYIVGGYLRDVCLNRVPLDIDLATNAKPNKVERIFSDCAVYDAGKNFGTLGIYSKKWNVAVEVTTFRRDLQCNGRKAVVEFSDTIDDDLKRRDFTINAMALNLETQEVLDPFNGQHDIERKNVRAVGNAYDRFQEDYLRMMRACRFMALGSGMQMDPETLEAIRRNARKIQRISAERLRMELLKGMKYPVPGNMIHTMKDTGLLKLILPELQQAVGVEQNRYHCVYMCKECGEFYTVKGNPADSTSVKIFPWEVDAANLDKDSESTLLLQQITVKYKEAWRELAKE
jgi:tRNA nucleotidyltransferase (CCA-adding enzyme)